MIRTSFGLVEINGSKSDLKADVIIVLRSMLKNNIIEESDLDDIVKNVKMSEKELENATREKLTSECPAMAGLFDALMSALDNFDKRQEE